jgi:hypothetical protein
VCAAAIAEANRQEIRRAIDIHRDNGGSLLLVTLTTSHHHKPLGQLYDRFGAARRALYSGGSWKTFKAALGCLGMIEAVELVWTSEHGWHLHTHTLWFLDKKFSEEHVGAVQAYFAKYWPRQLVKRGLSASAAHGVDVRLADMGAAEYITKFGHPRMYDVDDHLTDCPDRAPSPGMTPWDLLRSGTQTVDLASNAFPQSVGEGVLLRAVDARSTVLYPAQARQLFQEYAYVTRRRHHLRWSQGLREKLGMVPPPAEESTPGGERQEEEEKTVDGPVMWCFGKMPVPSWRKVVGNDARGKLRQALGAMDYDRLVALLVSIGIDWVPDRPYLAPMPVPRRR